MNLFQSGEARDDSRRKFVGRCLKPIIIPCKEGMIDDARLVIGDSEITGSFLGQSSKYIRNNDIGGYPCFFELDGIMHTA